VLRFDEFEDAIGEDGHLRRLGQLPQILGAFSVTGDPLFWVRLVALGFVCREFVRANGADLGFKYGKYSLRNLLLFAKDPFIGAQIDDYDRACSALPHMNL